MLITLSRRNEFSSTWAANQGHQVLLASEITQYSNRHLMHIHAKRSTWSNTPASMADRPGMSNVALVSGSDSTSGQFGR
eukprot:259224-Amphidinium_carterae.2